MPASNRERILEGAIECIQTKGVAATTARDIAAAAGGSLGSIPYHFGTVDALLDEALLVAMRRYTERVSAQVFAASSTDDHLAEGLIEATVASFSENRLLLLSLMETYIRALHNEDLRERVAAHREDVINGLAAVMSSHLPASPDREEQARHLGALLLMFNNGLTMHWLISGGKPISGRALLDALRHSGPLLFGTVAIEA